MIGKLLLMSGIIPVIVSVFARKFFCDRTLRRHGDETVAINGKEFAEAILSQGKVTGVEIEEKRRPFLPIGPERLVISPSICKSKKARDVAAAGLLAGLVLMARRQKKVVSWRAWAVKFGWAMPSFSVVIVTFATVATSLLPSMAIGIVLGILGFAALALWFTLPVEREAAKTVAHFLDDTAIVNRRSEAEVLSELVSALAWQRLVPGCVEWLVPKAKPKDVSP